MPDEPEQLGLVPDLIIDTRRRGPGPGRGRPHGSKNRSTEAFGRLARGYTPDIVRRLCEIALNDDTILGIAAAKLILDRTWPKPRHIPISLDITKMGETARGTPDLQAIMTEVLNRTAAGDLAPETAALISSIVKDVARINDDPHTVAAQSEIAQTDDPREELARRWLRLFEAENGKEPYDDQMGTGRNGA